MHYSVCPRITNLKLIVLLVTPVACTLACQNGGTCAGANRCKCLPGYLGSQCQFAVCKPFCRNGGVCVKPGQCKCPPNYFGKSCERGNGSRLREFFPVSFLLTAIRVSFRKQVLNQLKQYSLTPYLQYSTSIVAKNNVKISFRTYLTQRHCR